MSEVTGRRITASLLALSSLAGAAGAVVAVVAADPAGASTKCTIAYVGDIRLPEYFCPVSTVEVPANVLGSFQVTKTSLDPVSPAMFSAISSGKYADGVQLVFAKTGTTAPGLFLQYTFNSIDVKATGWVSSTAASGSPAEALTFNWSGVLTQTSTAG